MPTLPHLTPRFSRKPEALTGGLSPAAPVADARSSAADDHELPCSACTARETTSHLSNVERPITLPSPPPQLDTSLAWIYDLVRNPPLIFATRGENVFIHKTLSSQTNTPRPLLIAFAICATYGSLNQDNRAIFFQALHAHIAELLLTITSANNKNSTSSHLRAAI
ncbi:hypothetical protein B0H66DRAFT_595701 [Apodospora peruviana]|uniref:Uncharacterized protein n=1 Tax=Apodospora peruviana TaxID=516989 RepID=A0AAE0HSW8_9PEZI|nr:hypothetical protein B0H66DRAFT_595701 [Apodospora peruviana]